MSTTVDSRVVEMRFDNKQFEDGVANTISTLDKFKQKLNLTGATKGLEEVDAAAKRVDMSGLGSAVETVGLKFNAMYSIADQALRNITNSAINAGKRIVSALTIEPVKTGLQEYETQINAVQTILANTESKGTTLTDVNKALDELNTYADKTIYNFTEMTRNIGTFTAAGVDLDTSVNAIQGIANLAAVSGSSSQQASTAMYQLSQAMASGTVKLMDWNSVVNAGMGGQVFQDALKETAKVHGVNVDKMIKKHGSFRETLQEGWITTDILTETLSHFTMAAEEGSQQWEEFKKTLMDQGYSEDQANAILKMSNTATDAATKVKTATQLFDTLKETAQSGWTQTWEIIMGDFEEAKNLFSTLYESLAPVIEATSKARNDILEVWAKSGGRDHLIKALQNVFKAVSSIVKPIKEAFNEIFPASLAEKAMKLLTLTKGIMNFTAKLKLSDTASENLKRTFKGLFAVLDISKQAFSAVLKLLGPMVVKVGGGILEVSAKVGDWLVRLNELIKTSKFFEVAIDKIRSALEKVKTFLQPVIEGFKQFGNEVEKNFTAVADNAETRLGPLSAMGKFIMTVFTAVANVVKKVFPFVSAAASAIGNVLGDLMNRISDSIQNADYDSFFDLTSGGIIATIGVFIAKFIKSGSDLLDNAGGFVENINNILGGVSDALGAFTESLKADTLKKIATSIGILAVSLLVLSLIPSEQLTSSLAAITALFGELMGAMWVFSKMGDMKGINKTAFALIGLASAVFTLSIALKIMSTMSWSEMGVALVSMSVGLGELVGAVWLLSKMPEKKLKSSIKAIKGLAGALVVLAVALKIMSTMSWEEMGVALVSMSVGLGALVLAVKLLPKDTAARAAGMIGLATAMVILGAALKIMATMSWEDIARSLVALAGSLAVLAGAMALMKKMIPGAIAMMLVAPALIVLAGAMKILSGLSWEQVAIGLTALGGSLIIIAGAMTLMKTAIPGALALLVVAAALAVLTPVLMALGSMSLAEIGKSLLVLAGVFAVLGVAALVLKPVVPVILKLAASMVLLGVACVAIGAGIFMIGAGITMLATALASAGGAIVVFISSIISLIPFIIEQIGVGIIKLCDVIAGAASSICSAITVIIVAVVDALVTSVPHLVEGLMVLIVTLLETLITYVPQIVPLLVTLIATLLTSIAQHADTLVAAIFTFIGAILNAIASNLTKIIDPLVTLFGSIFQGIADIIGPIVQEVLAPILSVLGNVFADLFESMAPYIPQITAMFTTITTVITDAIVKITEILAPYIPDIVNMITTITTVVTNAIVKIMEVLAPFIPDLSALLSDITNAFVTLVQEISPIIDSIKGLIDTLGDKIIGIMNEVEETLTATGKIITDTLNEINETFDTVFNGISKVLDSVGDNIKKVLDGIAGVIESIGNAALNAGTGFENLANGVKIITELKLVDMIASLSAVAAGIGDIASHSKKIGAVASSMTQLSTSGTVASAAFAGIASSIATISVKITTVGSTLKKLVTVFKSSASEMKTSGIAMMTNLAAGIQSKYNTVKLAFTNLISTCSNAILSKANAFYSAGANLVKGFANGISANTYLAKARAKAMAAAAADAAKKELDEHSPSKVGYGIGDFFGIAFVNGIADNIKSAYTVSTNLAQSARDGMNNAIDKISTILSSDIDAQPTIRPVLDLSGVKSGASAINGMLGMDTSVGVRTNLTAISSMMNSRVQNGVNNSDVVSAINKLRKDMANVDRASYTINGITYDDGSNVAEAVGALARAIKIEGRT